MSRLPPFVKGIRIVRCYSSDGPMLRIEVRGATVHRSVDVDEAALRKALANG